MEPPLKAVAYVRVAPGAGADDTIERQRELVVRLAQERGWDIVETFEDRAHVGRQPGLGDALAAIQAGVAPNLVTPSMDRLARKPEGLGGVVNGLTESGGRLLTESGIVAFGESVAGDASLPCPVHGLTAHRLVVKTGFVPYLDCIACSTPNEEGVTDAHG